MQERGIVKGVNQIAIAGTVNAVVFGFQQRFFRRGFHTDPKIPKRKVVGKIGAEILHKAAVKYCLRRYFRKNSQSSILVI